MADKPGELHERPWVDFSHNRNEALELAKPKADYILFIDADEHLVFKNKFKKNQLTKPYYFSIVQEPKVRSKRAFLIDTVHDWKWIGVVHETIYCEGLPLDPDECFDNLIKISNTTDGFRSRDPDKYLKDAQLLENALIQYPGNPRYTFYLAQSYMNANQHLLALKNYEKRAGMGASEEERWFSSYMVARLHEAMGFPSEVVTQEYCKAFQERNYRAEPLGYLAHHHLSKGNYILAYVLAEQALQMKMPSDIVFVEDWFYDYGFLAIYADAALRLGLKAKALDAYKKVLGKEVPLAIRNKVESDVANLESEKQLQPR